MDIFNEIERSFSARSSQERRRLAVEMAVIVSPYGSVAPTIIDPDNFASIVSCLEDAYATGDSSELAAIQGSCRQIINLHPDDEPDGAGFFAFAAIVSVYYAAEALMGAAIVGLLNGAKRFLDVLSAADDDRGAGVFTAGHDYLLEPNQTKASSLRNLVRIDAERLRGIGANG